MVDSDLTFQGRISAPKRAVRRGPPFEWGSLVFGLVFTGMLAGGWYWREHLPWTPEHGTGYWLGIIGLSCVGVLLLYPLRKRVAFLRAFGSVPTWFRIHMFLGALAPVLILFHSKFSISSLNANVALTCMLVVAGSGIIGRFLYVRIYRGVAGRKQEARRLLNDASAYRQNLNLHFEEAVELAEGLEALIGKARHGLFGSLFHAIRASRRINKAQRMMIAAVRRGIREVPGTNRQRRQTRKEAISLVRKYCETLRAAAQLEIFERLFSLWHVVHLPLFFLMLIAATIHVLAVHQY